MITLLVYYFISFISIFLELGPNDLIFQKKKYRRAKSLYKYGCWACASLRDFLVEQVIGGLSEDGLKVVLGTHFSVKTAVGLYKKMVGRKQRENESIVRPRDN